jgi:hypothetical protein
MKPTIGADIKAEAAAIPKIKPIFFLSTFI